MVLPPANGSGWVVWDGESDVPGWVVCVGESDVLGCGTSGAGAVSLLVAPVVPSTVVPAVPASVTVAPVSVATERGASATEPAAPAVAAREQASSTAKTSASNASRVLLRALPLNALPSGKVPPTPHGRRPLGRDAATSEAKRGSGVHRRTDRLPVHHRLAPACTYAGRRVEISMSREVAARGDSQTATRRRPARPLVGCNSMVARDITLPVDPDEAWDALTDPELLEQWFGDGEREAVVEEAEPGERLVFWWWEEGEPGSRVELRLVAVPDGTRVSVREAPVGPFALAGA